MLKWLNGLELSSLRRAPCGSRILEKDIVLQIEKTVDSSPKEITVKNILVKPQLLFKVINIFVVKFSIYLSL